jgi:hypothetical protein
VRNVADGECRLGKHDTKKTLLVDVAKREKRNPKGAVSSTVARLKTGRVRESSTLKRSKASRG